MAPKQLNLIFFLQGCDFPSIPSLLSFCLDDLSRDLTLLLRRFAALKRVDHTRVHVTTLLKVVLRLKKEDDDEKMDLRDALDGLLTQLDLSWIDPTGGGGEDTEEILRIVLIFVGNLRGREEDDNGKQEEKVEEEDDEGFIANFVSGEEGHSFVSVNQYPFVRQHVY